ncbi:MAG TPA: Lar family restriction alleviation protein [Slackia equolifaciens]|uniref:Lar family restriction alleviation protein n=1 Tax=Slackia equolifaciens TaxID=498718 RepID=A0A9D3A0R7_9ACTN|nr:Lar family restriction alleviation protein [Slackia equolifaciens]
MNEELSPCPFCGGEAEMVTNRSGDNFVRCTNRQCAAKTGLHHENENGARLAWNRRAERTCRMELRWTDGEDGECYECSECGDIAFTHCDAPEYCPNCGAKVVDE